MRFGAPLLVLGIAAAIIIQTVDGDLWDDNLSALSPVAVDRLTTDRNLRTAAVTPDMRYQLVLHEAELESLLTASEAVDELLEDAAAAGLLDGWQSVTQLLPSQQTQQRRQNAIPDNGV